jgi:hypothetical protein
MKFFVVRINGDDSDTFAATSKEGALEMAMPDEGDKVEVRVVNAKDAGAARLMFSKGKAVKESVVRSRTCEESYRKLTRMTQMLSEEKLEEGISPQGIATKLIQKFGGKTLNYMPGEVEFVVAGTVKDLKKELGKGLKKKGAGYLYGTAGNIMELTIHQETPLRIVVRDYRK